MPRATAALKEVGLEHVSPGLEVRPSAIALQQLVEIARAVALNRLRHHKLA